MSYVLFVLQLRKPTLLFIAKLFAFWSILFLRISSISSVSARNVHNGLLYSPFKHNGIPGLPNDPSQQPDNNFLDQFEEWAGVQGLWDILDVEINATPSRQELQSKVTPSVSHRAFTSGIKPTPSALLPDTLKNGNLYRRGSFTSNICPINTQTTVFVSVDGSSTRTLSTTSGPRPTGIPGDTGTSDGNDPNGGSTDSGSSSGQGLSGREGLITGLVIVIAILLASFCALFTYCYKKRRNARIQRLSSQRGGDAAEIVRRMGSKGVVNLSASGKPLPRRSFFSGLSPIAFFGSLVRRLNPSRRRSERDSQSSELLERKPQFGQRSPIAWSVENVPPPIHVNPVPARKSLAPPRRKSTRSSVLSIPPIITSSTRPELPIASTSKSTETPSPRGSSAIDFVPLVQRRVDGQQLTANRNSGLQPIAIEPLRSGSTPDLGRRDPSPRRNSQGEPLSPSAWMAGFGVVSGSNPEVFTNPSYHSSSDLGHSSSSYPEGQLSPRSISSASVQSNQTIKARPASPERTQQRLSLVTESNDLRPDGASDIMSALGSAFGDRPDSSRSAMESQDNHNQNQNQSQNQNQNYSHQQPQPPTLITKFHPLSDVEEVLTPVADERLSIHIGSPRARRPSNASNMHASPSSTKSAEIIAFQNPFVDDQTFPLPPTPMPHRMRKAPMFRRKSDAASLTGGVSASEESGSLSLTNTSIVEPPVPIDNWDWDDKIARKREEDQLFYAGALRSSSPTHPGEPSSSKGNTSQFDPANPFRG